MGAQPHGNRPGGDERTQLPRVDPALRTDDDHHVPGRGKVQPGQWLLRILVQDQREGRRPDPRHDGRLVCQLTHRRDARPP